MSKYYSCEVCAEQCEITYWLLVNKGMKSEKKIDACPNCYERFINNNNLRSLSCINIQY